MKVYPNVDFSIIKPESPQNRPKNVKKQPTENQRRTLEHKIGIDLTVSSTLKKPFLTEGGLRIIRNVSK